MATRGTFTMVENPVPWPNGARCAVASTWNLDADSILHLAHPDVADRITLACVRDGRRGGFECSPPTGRSRGVRKDGAPLLRRPAG